MDQVKLKVWTGIVQAGLIMGSRFSYTNAQTLCSKLNFEACYGGMVKRYALSLGMVKRAPNESIWR